MLPLQFITPSAAAGLEALAGGCRWIQLRMKNATDDEIRTEALKLRDICHEKACILILDDKVELCKELKLDGVHLGQHDMPVPQARQILGEEAIIGATANTPEQALQAAKEGADYLGVGPFRFTTTKEKLAPTLGTEGLAKIVETLRNDLRRIPVVAIGGITPDDIDDIMQTGVNGVAVSGGILHARNIQQATQNFLNTY